VGVREDVFIRDAGNAWEVSGRARRNRLADRDLKALRQVLRGWNRKNPKPETYCALVRDSLEKNKPLPAEKPGPATKAFKGLDAALQAGIRHTAASDYSTLQGGQASESTCCVAQVPLADGLLAFAGKKRVQGGVGDVVFLPVYEGEIDLSRVVSPLRVWIDTPNVTCAKAFMLLALRSSLFAEGYHDRLTAVAFNTSFDSRKRDNHSGVIGIASTAIGRIRTGKLTSHLHRVFGALARGAWKRGRATSLVPDALTMAHWLMHPLPKHLSSFITTQERRRRDRQPQVFVNSEYVREVFEMSVANRSGDHEAVQKFAKAVASGIYYARMVPAKKRGDDPQKAWYDEVTMLRSASSPKAFRERALILIEQGHRERSLVGTKHWEQAYDPPSILASMGKGSSFEEFRDLFRMYLVQASTYQEKGEEGEAGTEEDRSEDELAENEKEDVK
jgi:hypothetical protein